MGPMKRDLTKTVGRPQPQLTRPLFQKVETSACQNSIGGTEGVLGPLGIQGRNHLAETELPVDASEGIPFNNRGRYAVRTEPSVGGGATQLYISNSLV